MPGIKRTRATPSGTPADRRSKPVFTGKARPHYVSEMNVLDAARARMKWLFDEFDGKVSVSCSGGKDSTVVLELAAEVARERGEKLRVVFIDQEAEFQGTVDYMRYLQTRDDINLEWYQIPFKLFNATNHENEWLQVWGPGEDWMRPMEPDSIKDVELFDRRSGRKLDRWMEIVDGVNRRTGDAILVGMRAEESPTRRVSMISAPAYKWITWSAGPGHSDNGRPLYSFQPIWDWSYRDVWRAISEMDWKYNDMYDKQYRIGVPMRSMRVSSFHHSQALNSLKTLQELEPETWEVAIRRLDGISTQGHIGEIADLVPGLPYMFGSWVEYMHYLIDTLTDERHRPTFRKNFENLVRVLYDTEPEDIAQHMIVNIIHNDYTGKSDEQYILTRAGKQQHKKKAAENAERLKKLAQEALEEQEAAF